MLTISAQETLDYLSYDALIPALQKMFESGAQAPLRHHHTIPSTGIDSTLLLMPAWSKHYGGIKLVNVNPDNNAKDIPSISASYLLFDTITGQHLCVMDASVMTARRTAAASALAASYLAKPDSSCLLVVGAGKVGSEIPDAFKAVLPLQEVLVWNRNEEKSTILVNQLIEKGWNARVVSVLEDGVRQADIISCATLATDSIIKGEWLSPGQHVDLIGSFTPSMREVDDQAIKRSKIFIDTQAAVKESGELLIPINNGTIVKDDIKASLYELCSVDKNWRNPDDITLFKGVGHAIEDLAAATLIYQSIKK